MLKLRLSQKVHVPNGLAVFAALLLLVSSIAGFEANRETYSSGQKFKPTAEAETAETDSVKDVVEHKSRRLNLGLLLFRRG
jgi:hypothetical protein